MLVVGVMTTIGLAALGMPGALYLGIIAGLLEIIPNLGPIIAAVPAVIVALIQGSASLPISNLAFAGLIILFYILVQQVEDKLIVPRVLGAALELPPLIVMTGIVVGASVGGISRRAAGNAGHRYRPRSPALYLPQDAGTGAHPGRGYSSRVRHSSFRELALLPARRVSEADPISIARVSPGQWGRMSTYRLQI